MNDKELIKHARRLSERYKHTRGRRFRLKDTDPAGTAPLDSGDKDRAQQALSEGVQMLAEMQSRLYAQDRWAVLLIFQAMDAAGKDGAIKHVMSGVNPQGCQVYSFKAPSPQELDHDYLWRCMNCLPERGRIGIFNRSYYEEVLAVRVHPEYLDRQKLPRQLIGKNIWEERYEDIRGAERYLSRNGVVIRKFFLHVSKGEQRRRLLERTEDPGKNWKFSMADLAERAHWDDYMDAYESMVQHTATEHAPWYVIPADNKWFTRLVVAAAVVDAMSELDLEYPKLDRAQRADLDRARAALRKK